jgi:hypothetical protein
MQIYSTAVFCGRGQVTLTLSYLRLLPEHDIANHRPGQ